MFACLRACVCIRSFAVVVDVDVPVHVFSAVNPLPERVRAKAVGRLLTRAGYRKLLFVSVFHWFFSCLQAGVGICE